MLYLDENDEIKDTRNLVWWKKNSLGYPIEKIKGRPITNFFRMLFGNLNKIWRMF